MQDSGSMSWSPVAAAIVAAVALAVTAIAGTGGQDVDPPTKPYERAAPPAATARVQERETMIRRQMAAPSDGRQRITSETVMKAIRSVPRHAFVPETLQREAYLDSPLPIGHGQTISQPYIVALMTELLELTPTSKVLEIGTGSGYQAAVLAHLTPDVFTIEIIEPLAKRADATFRHLGYDEIKRRQGDGYYGWKEEAPFDAIIVTCAAGHLPPPLWDQLAIGGRIVIPIGGTHELQRLVVVEKAEDGSRRTRTHSSVRFVPLTRAPAGEARDPGD